MRQLYKPINVAIGARIRLAREEARLTREEFSEQIEISTQFLTDLERGRMGASLETLLKICDTLSLPTDSILREPHPSVEETAKQISIMLDGIPPELLPLVVDGVRNHVKIIKETLQLSENDQKDT